MIESLKHSSISFGTNNIASVRDAYKAQVDKIEQTAQKQNGLISNSFLGQIKQVPHEGKLDVIA